VKAVDTTSGRRFKKLETPPWVGPVAYAEERGNSLFEEDNKHSFEGASA
jgi:hypothetical protein